MRHDVQLRLAREIFAHLDAGTTDLAGEVCRNPVSSYTDQARLEREIGVLFRRYPLLMGLSCRIPKPGDFLTDDYSGIPILLVRGEDGRARAFYNVCRHRGARVAEGYGNRPQWFVCPFHGWSYDLAGRLREIPDERSFPGVERERSGLVPLPAAERHGLLWVQPALGQDGLELDPGRHLGEVDPEIAAYGFERYHHYETRVLQQRMNWKLVMDTFLEPYHLGELHRNTVATLFEPNVCLFHPFGRHLREILPRRSFRALRERPERDWDLIAHSVIVYVLFPNTVLVIQADHVETWRVYPWQNRADECVMVLDFFVPEPATTDSARRHWDKNMDLTIGTVRDEDFPTGEGIQRGFASGAQTHVTYGRNEPALAYFQRTVAAELEAG